MQLGFVLFKFISGDIQQALGYRHFFVWVMVAAIPVLVLSRFMRFEPAAAPSETGSPASP